jgi:hypothetical protein
MDSQNPFIPTADSVPLATPYQPGYGAPQGPVSTTGLTVTTVLFTLFGVLGILATIAVVAGFFLASFFESFANPQNNAFVQKMQDAQKMFMIPGLVLGILNGLLSVGLLYSATGLGSNRLWGAEAGIRFCNLGIGFEILRLLFVAGQQIYIISIMMAAGTEVAGGNGPPGAEQAAFFGAVIGGGIGLVFSLIYYIGKILMYVYCGKYLRKETTQSLLK